MYEEFSFRPGLKKSYRLEQILWTNLSSLFLSVCVDVVLLGHGGFLMKLMDWEFETVYNAGWKYVTGDYELAHFSQKCSSWTQ